MVFLHITNHNQKKEFHLPIRNDSSVKQLERVIHHNANNKIFMLVYMEGCGPCNNVRPEWTKLQNVLKEINNRSDIAIVDIDKDYFERIKYIQNKKLTGFPTIIYITKKGEIIENYEDSNVKNKDRSIDSFVEWINLKTKNETPKNNNTRYNKTYKKSKGSKTKKYYGGKWSSKYKSSINCKRPRGFSQKQYCKYGR
jgi:vacuolar-type H+-ATPase subunit F/Vma7